MRGGVWAVTKLFNVVWTSSASEYWLLSLIWVKVLNWPSVFSDPQNYISFQWREWVALFSPEGALCSRQEPEASSPSQFLPWPPGARSHQGTGMFWRRETSRISVWLPSQCLLLSTRKLFRRWSWPTSWTSTRGCWTLSTSTRRRRGRSRILCLEQVRAKSW